MTHTWLYTPDGAELVVDGAVRARVYRTGGWGCRFGWSAADTHGIERRVTDSDAKQVAQRAAERALGLAGQDVPRSGHHFNMPTVTESPEFPPPNDSESPKGSPWSCSCGASGVAPDPGPESCPKCGAGEDGVQRAPAPYDILADAARLVDVDRQAQYGDPVEAHEAIAAIMTTLGGISADPNDAEFEAVGMIVRKLVRRMAGAEPRECYRDLIGYAVIAERCARA